MNPQDAQANKHLPERHHDAELQRTRGDIAAETAKMLMVARRLLRSGPELLHKDDTAIWAGVLADAGVEAGDVMPALLAHIQNEKWFPSPCEIIEQALRIREHRIQAIRQMRIAEAEQARLQAESQERKRWLSLTPEQQEAECAPLRELRARYSYMRDDGPPSGPVAVRELLTDALAAEVE